MCRQLAALFLAWSRSLRFFVTAGALIVLSACVDLSAIREFAASSSNAASYESFVDEYVAFYSANSRFADLNGDGQITREELDVIQFDLRTVERSSQRAALIELHAVVANYMDALGNLASDDVVNVDTQFSALGSAVGSLEIITPEVATAATSISSLLTTAILEGWRRAELREFIAASNTDFQLILQALHNFVEGIALEDDATERDLYRAYLTRLRNQSSDPAAIAALNELELLWNQRIDQEAASKDAYLLVLQDIGEGHQELFDNLDEIREEQVLSDVRAYERRIRTTFNALRAL